MNKTSHHAPAKINLHLHVTGDTANGYHTLDSWVIFTRFGDDIAISLAPQYTLDITGPYADMITQTTTNADNLATKALLLAQQYAGISDNLHITLTKNIPAGAGLGGGSSDAASLLKALRTQHPNILTHDVVKQIAQEIGSDVSVFLNDGGIIMRGTGELNAPAPTCPPLPVVLIYPRFLSSTPDVYKIYADGCSENYSANVVFPKSFATIRDVCNFLKSNTHNDLYKAAITLTPQISQVISAFENEPDCLLARMSGSGSSCFGIFASDASAQACASRLTSQYPSWDVITTHSI